MTLFSDIQAAQSQWHYPLARKRFLVQINLANVELFNPNLFDLWLYDPTKYLGTEPDTTAYLTLFPKIERNDILSAPRELQVSTTGSTYQTSTIRYAFRGTINEAPIYLYQTLNRTIKESHAGHSVVVPIKVIDFINPDLSGDFPIVESLGDFGTPREGVINISQHPGNQVMGRKGSQAIALSTTPWSFTYQDIELTF